MAMKDRSTLTREELRIIESASSLNAARLRKTQLRNHALAVQRGQRRRRLAVRRQQGG